MSKAVLVTQDKWQRVEGGILDPDDRRNIREASENGRLKVVVMNLEQSLRDMQAHEPEKFKEFQAGQEKIAGKALTIEQIAQMSRDADKRKTVYDSLCRTYMVANQACEVRRWRIEMRYTWRSVARAASRRLGDGWTWGQSWYPVSNQLMGMALCERAATILEENYRQDPWN